MNDSWIKIAHHTYALKSSCGIKFIDRDSRGWKLYTTTLGRWTYFHTLEEAKAAA